MTLNTGADYIFGQIPIMKNFICYFLPLLFLHQAYAQPTGDKKLLKLLDEAKEKHETYFVTTIDGDTLRGNSLKRRVNIVAQRKSKFIIGNNTVLEDSVRSYQDEFGYVYVYPHRKAIERDLYGSEFVRVYIGKISLFMAEVTRGMRIEDKVTSIIFYLSRDSLTIPGIIPATAEFLKDMISECKPALEVFEQTFKKANNTAIKDYNKIVAVLRKFDTCD